MSETHLQPVILPEKTSLSTSVCLERIATLQKGFGDKHSACLLCQLSAYLLVCFIHSLLQHEYGLFYSLSIAA